MYSMGSSVSARAPATWAAPRRRSTDISVVRSAGDDRSRSTQANCYTTALAPAPVAAKTLSSYEQSPWGNFFIEYEPQPLQRSEEWMRLRVDELTQAVCVLFNASHGLIGKLTLVDAVQCLGIDHLFQEQIDIALRDVHECEFSSSNLYEVALHFRLLREHGLWVSADVFGKFKDECGSFSKDTTNDPKGLLGMYNDSFLSVHDEPKLEEAKSFARCHLESMSGNLKSPLAEQVNRALHIHCNLVDPGHDLVCGMARAKKDQAS